MSILPFRSAHFSTLAIKQNPGLADHGNKECKDVPFFPWDINVNWELAEEFGCQVKDIQIDHHTKADRVRLYAEWIKQ